MTYWIASTNRQNWGIIKTHNIWGIPKRHKTIHSRVKKGDILLIFVSQQKEGEKVLPSAITGAYEITDVHEKTTPLFTAPRQMGDEVFPYRFNLKPVIFFKKPLEFKPLIPDLQFITNKVMWTGHLRVAMREIPEDDYLYIIKKGDKNV